MAHDYQNEYNFDPVNAMLTQKRFRYENTSCVRESETTEITALQVARIILQYECSNACEDVRSILKRYMHEKTVCANV